MQNADYSPHCGHGIIGLATAAVELGWVERTTPETRVGIDAPCGFIEAFVEWDGTHAANVRFVNVPPSSGSSTSRSPPRPSAR